MISRTIALAVALAAGSTSAIAATRNFSVVTFDRVRVDGPFRVTLKTNVAPFATAEGSAAALDGISIDVQGRTLIVRSAAGSWGGYPGESRGPVEIGLGTHELSAAWVNGSGGLSIDAVKGLSFDLAVQGAGSANIAKVDVDQLRVGLAGAASASLAGVAPRLTATVRGTSSFDGSALAVKDVTLGSEGPAVVKLNATSSAKIDASGPGSVSVTGGAACTVRAAGSVSIEGCH